jgi:hypothetical protein
MKHLHCISFNVQEALKEIEYLVSLSKVPLVLSNAMGTVILHSEVRNLSYGTSSAARLSSQLHFASLSDMTRVLRCNYKDNLRSRETKFYERYINVTTSNPKTRGL